MTPTAAAPSRRGRGHARSAFRGRRPNWAVLAVLVLVLSATAYGAVMYFSGGPAVNILIMGLDEGGTRSDVVMVAHTNFRAGKVSLVSLPRDTRVEIPGRKGYDKLAHAYGIGQAELAERTVEKLLGIPIDYYVSIDLKGFVELVDLAGGVDLTIDQNMNYDDPYQNLHIHFKKGPQHLDGKKALEYVRWRKNNTGDSEGDIPRTDRTHQFMTALLVSAKKNIGLTGLPKAVSVVAGATETNLDTGAMLKLGRLALGLDSKDIRSATLPGDPQGGGAWYWVPRRDALPEFTQTYLTAAGSSREGK